ncbi:MAG: DUF6273 domain-containing protein [Ruminococcus sp.]|nr:DUF6273 domain-containing protein [Ruminococcus sp.]
MSEQLTKPILLDETFSNKMDTTNALLAMIATDSDITSYSKIQRIVQMGLAEKVFDIGTQINVNWTDSVSGTVYEVPMDVVHFEDVELQDGTIVPGMFLQWHYSTPFSLQFDQSEALYYCSEDLAAGTYYFTIGSTWGSCVSGTSYYFTTTENIPAGGQIRIGGTSETAAWEVSSTEAANWRVYTYSSNDSTFALESGLELTEGTEGTSLGTTTSSIKYADSGINNLQRASLGYGRWSHSGVRQYLNSSASIGSWWTPQNAFDRPPSQLAKYPGFMSGFDSDFLAVIKPIKVTTALNTTSDSDIGTSEDTYDTFFLPSLEQEFITPQVSGVEGDYWEYWKRACGRTTTTPRNVTYANGGQPITYAINAKTTAQSVRLRSCSSSNAYHAWSVGTSGSVASSSSSYSLRLAPACVIC